jgi:hypothetical protein
MEIDLNIRYHNKVVFLKNLFLSNFDTSVFIKSDMIIESASREFFVYFV